MRQQINLYHAFIEKPVENTPLTWTRLWALTTIFALYFLLMSVVTIIQTYWLSHRVDTALAAVNRSQANFEEIKRTYPALFFSDNADAEIKALQHQLDSQQTILRQLSIKSNFSSYLITLAQATTQQVWLTQFDIDAETHTLNLNGTTLAMAKLNQFMQALAKQPLFKEANLEIKNIDADKQNENPQFNFQLMVVTT